LASYRRALAALLSDDRKARIVTVLAKSEQPFRSLQETGVFGHNQSLTRALRSLEDLGVVEHTYRHASPQVFSFYSLTPIGRDVFSMMEELDKFEPKEAHAEKRRPAKRPTKVLLKS
jgi:DNA-binding HxlR family transcriptional regulator